MPKLKVLAHRTGMGENPPNSLKSMLQCFSDGAGAVECDISFVQGSPFVWTDTDNRKELQDSLPNITKIPFQKIPNLKRKHIDEPILSIYHFLQRLSTLDDFKLYLDVKYYAADLAGEFSTIPHKLIDLVIETIVGPAIRMDVVDKLGFVAFGGGINLLREIKAADKNISTELIVALPWTDIHEHIPCLDSISIGWKAKAHWWLWRTASGSMKRIINDARFGGIKVNGGIANGEKEASWLAGQGFDGIWTDYPQKTEQFLKRQEWR